MDLILNKDINRTCIICREKKSIIFFRNINKYGNTVFKKSCYSCRNVNKDYRIIHQDKRRQCNLKRLYGMSYEDFNKRLDAQNGVCEICKLSPIRKVYLSVDHNHSTGKVRGIICHKCNVIIGRIENNMKVVSEIKSYLSYLEKYS